MMECCFHSKGNQMSTNSSKWNTGKTPSSKPQNTFFIKFGDQYFEIHEQSIAYAFHSESVLFIVHSDGQKLPISTFTLQNFYLQLDQRQFFKISDDVIVNRNAIFHLEEYENQLLVSLNFKKVVSFKIAAHRIKNFKKWLTN